MGSINLYIWSKIQQSKRKIMIVFFWSSFPIAPFLFNLLCNALLSLALLSTNAFPRIIVYVLNALGGPHFITYMGIFVSLILILSFYQKLYNNYEKMKMDLIKDLLFLLRFVIVLLLPTLTDTTNQHYFNSSYVTIKYLHNVIWYNKCPT